MNLKKMSTDELYEELQAAITQTAAGLQRMAFVWVELQNRGEDLSAFKSPLLSFLPDVASGKLLPEMLLRYGQNEFMLSQISNLVPEEQSKLALNDGKVEVIDAPNSPPRRVRLIDLTRARVRQVIGDGRLRTPSEQKRHVPPPRPTSSYSRQKDAANSQQQTDETKEPRIEDFATLAQWESVCNAAEKAGVNPYQQIWTWLVKCKCVPPATKTSGRRAPSQDEATRRGISQTEAR